MPYFFCSSDEETSSSEPEVVERFLKQNRGQIADYKLFMIKMLYHIIDASFFYNETIKGAYNQLKKVVDLKSSFQQIGGMPQNEPQSFDSAQKFSQDVIPHRNKKINLATVVEKNPELSNLFRQTLSEFQTSTFTVTITNQYEFYALPRLLSRIVKFVTTTKRFSGFQEFVVDVVVPNFHTFDDGIKTDLKFHFTINDNKNSQIKVFGLEEYYNLIKIPNIFSYFQAVSSLIKHEPLKPMPGELNTNKHYLQGAMELLLVEGSRNLLSLLLVPMFIELSKIDEHTKQIKEKIDSISSDSEESKSLIIAENLFAMGLKGATAVSRNTEIFFKSLDYGERVHGMNTKETKSFFFAIINQFSKYKEYCTPGGEISFLQKAVCIHDLSNQMSLIGFSPDAQPSDFNSSHLNLTFLKECAKNVKALGSNFQDSFDAISALQLSFVKFSERQQEANKASGKKRKITEKTTMVKLNVVSTDEADIFVSHLLEYFTTLSAILEREETAELLLFRFLIEELPEILTRCQDFYGIDDLFAPVIREISELDQGNFLSIFEPSVESLGELDGSMNE